jgi:hypothetical protein
LVSYHITTLYDISEYHDLKQAQLLIHLM